MKETSTVVLSSGKRLNLSSSIEIYTIYLFFV